MLTNDDLQVLLLCKNAEFSYASDEYGQGYYISKILKPDDKLCDIVKTSNVFILSAILTQQFQIGCMYEPIKLIVKYFDYNKCELTEKIHLFHKHTSIEHVKEGLTKKGLITDLGQTTLTLVMNAKPDLTYNLSSNESNKTKLNDFEFLRNFDFLLIENSLNSDNTNLSRKLDKRVEQIDIQLIDCIVSFTATSICINKNDEIKNLKISAISAFALDNIDYDNCHLRYINREQQTVTSVLAEYKNSKQATCANLGLRLYDHDLVNCVVNENSNIFALCSDRAPNKNEITLKCCVLLDCSSSRTGYLLDDVKCEILVENTTKISVLVSSLVDVVRLPEIDVDCQHKYYLKTINWMGDVDQILNNLNKTVNDVKLKNNDYICLTKGLKLYLNKQLFLNQHADESYNRTSNELILIL